MMANNRWLWPLLVLVAVVQSAALFKIVYDRDRLLKSGREIAVAVQPLDPRDLFRGDYVTLGYDFTNVQVPSTTDPDDASQFPPGSDAFVTLTQGSDNRWTVGKVTSAFPKVVAPSDVVLKARVKSAWRQQDKSATLLNVRYGIESYFVPEGTGRTLEGKVREHAIQALLAVGSDGTAALKGLVVDGERHVDPPLL
jgi:uncharacterized membrane-anchored protein